MRRIGILALVLLVLVTIPAAQAVMDHGKEAAGPAHEKPGRWIAHTTDEKDIADFQAKGCRIVHRLQDATAIACPPGVEKRLGNIEEDRVFYIMDSAADQQINADDVWNLGFTGSGVRVAVLDTGIDRDHPELADSIAGGASFVSGLSPPNDLFEDDNGHGTHVAGIITANGQDPVAKGVAPGAEVWMGKVCNAQGSCYTSDIARAIEYVASHQDETGRVISISLGGGGTTLSSCDWDYLAQKVNTAVTTKGVTVVAAAGNNGRSVTSPGCASKAIAVGAVDSGNKVASFSGRGSALDITAPGVSIYSSVIGGYARYSGTSMATPHVTATIALMLQKNGGLTDSQIKSRLYTTAKDLGSRGWDRLYGNGRVDALAAVNAA